MFNMQNRSGSVFAKVCSAIVLLHCFAPPVQAATPAQMKESAKLQVQAEALHKTGDEAGAIKVNSEALNQTPDNAALYVFRAWVLGNQSKNKEALEAANRAVELNPSPTTYTVRGNFLRETGNFKKSIEDCSTAIKINSKFCDAYMHRSSGYRLSHQLDRALADSNTAIAIDPKRGDAYFKRADVYADLKQLDKALADYTKHSSLEPKNPWPKLRMAQILDQLNRPAEALVLLDSMIKQFPKFSHGYVAHALILDRDPKNDPIAIGDLDKAISLDPGISGYYELRFWRLLRQKEPEKALQDANKVISLSPNNSGGYALRAHCYDVLRQFDKAALDADKASRLSPKLPGIDQFRSHMYKLAGKEARVEKSLDNKVGKKGDSVKGLIERADYYLYSLNQADKALVDYKKAAVLEPKNPLAWAGMSDAYRSLKRKDDAYKVLNQAIDVIPDSAVLYNARSAMRTNFLMDKEALADINKAISLDPKADYFQVRANILIGMGEFDRALKDCDTIISKEPKNALGYSMQGDLYLNLDRYQKAIDSFTRALKIFAGDKHSLQNRAFCYDKLGKSREALTDYRQLVANEPSNTKWRLQKANLESQVGNKQAAIEDYTAAIKQSKQPILARIYQERARLYDKLGNSDKAAADRKKAQSMSKSFYADVLERKK